MNFTPSAPSVALSTSPASSASTPPPTLNSSMVNASGYLIDDFHEEPGFTELQTVVIACVGTLIPLALALFAVIGLRMIWKSWIRDEDERTLRRTESSEPKSSHMLLPDEIKTSESQFSVIPAEELEEVMTSYASAPSVNSNNHNHTSKSTANGSIITMTMKNNHLIVETEERILGVSETPYLSTPSEVPTLPVDDDEGDSTALIHQTEDDTPVNTGLSQSDLSVSSGASGHAGYCYGNQAEYLGDERTIMHKVRASSNRLKHIPFVVQPSQDIEDDDLYLEQQHQLGNGLDNQAVPEVQDDGYVTLDSSRTLVDMK
ncbi:uncharacterized protein LOC129004139 [Macrosteles quadrilineatus]|uniref:uncharacterized protein LOC129004139 n=1 Tax=Macrosteles quadrilineatus TaxID=74068 RepID=UPI0023E204E1|nr:uncharacterized protein LOC129004139 [Macrosteles quadrilineatus]